MLNHNPICLSSYFFRLRDGLPISDFSELHAAIHLAHKYQCPDVETRALSILKQFYTPSFTDHVQFDPSTASLIRPPREAAIAAVNIARLTETPSMLPFALYEACTLEERVLDGYTRRDGSAERLTPDDLRLCLRARHELARQMTYYTKEAFGANPSNGCRRTAQCTSALCGIWNEVEMDALGGCNIFDAYTEVMEMSMEDFQVELCKACTEELLVREEAGRMRVWSMLPRIFRMTSVECGFTD